MSAQGEAEKMHRMYEWLVQVCSELGLEPKLLDAVVPHLLDLTRDVAHGPSKPAAPMTAFLIGVAAAQGSPDGLEQRVLDHVTRLQDMIAERY